MSNTNVYIKFGKWLSNRIEDLCHFISIDKNQLLLWRVGMAIVGVAFVVLIAIYPSETLSKNSIKDTVLGGLFGIPTIGWLLPNLSIAVLLLFLAIVHSTFYKPQKVIEYILGGLGIALIIFTLIYSTFSLFFSNDI